LWLDSEVHHKYANVCLIISCFSQVFKFKVRFYYILHRRGSTIILLFDVTAFVVGKSPLNKVVN